MGCANELKIELLQCFGKCAWPLADAKRLPGVPDGFVGNVPRTQLCARLADRPTAGSLDRPIARPLDRMVAITIVRSLARIALSPKRVLKLICEYMRGRGHS